MESIAIIVEYNPLHNGHLHQIKQCKLLYPNATLIAILNGNFLQRGEPAIASKYTRAQWAVDSGCDVVLELPFAFGTQRADIFADGAVQIAEAFGAKALIYGVEALEDDADLLAMLPNQRLGFFYKKAILERGFLIEAIPIQRVHSQFNGIEITHDRIASATSIRHLLHTDLATVATYVPSYVFAYFNDHDGPFVCLEDYYMLLQQALIRPNNDYTAMCQFGLFESVKSSLETTTNFADFFAKVHHKHTSKTHIQRLLTYLICNVPQKQLDEATKTIWTSILALSNNGCRYIRYWKNHSHKQIPLIQRHQDLQKPHDMLQYNSMIAYALLQKIPLATIIAQHKNKKIIRRNSKYEL
ncbi:MAG: nucleotidyltransferase family protein [Culicoidibacterales bacterium]